MSSYDILKKKYPSHFWVGVECADSNEIKECLEMICDNPQIVSDISVTGSYAVDKDIILIFTDDINSVTKYCTGYMDVVDIISYIYDGELPTEYELLWDVRCEERYN